MCDIKNLEEKVAANTIGKAVFKKSYLFLIIICVVFLFINLGLPRGGWVPP